MKHIIYCIALLFLIGCNSNNSESQYDLAVLEKAENPTEYKKDYTYYYDSITNSGYKLKFGVNKLKDDVYELVIDVKLLNDSFYVSPNAKRDFKGKFTIEMEDSQKLTILKDWDEVPRSVEEFDPHPFVDGYVNWVREDTRYILKVKRNSMEDFNINTTLQFVIEPKCTLEKFPLVVRNQGGYLKFQISGC